MTAAQQNAATRENGRARIRCWSAASSLSPFTPIPWSGLFAITPYPQAVGMNSGRILLVALLSTILGTDLVLAQDVISINPGVVVADTARRPIGINTDYLID